MPRYAKIIIHLPLTTAAWPGVKREDLMEHLDQFEDLAMPELVRRYTGTEIAFYRHHDLTQNRVLTQPPSAEEATEIASLLQGVRRDSRIGG